MDDISNILIQLERDLTLTLQQKEREVRKEIALKLISTDCSLSKDEIITIVGLSKDDLQSIDSKPNIVDILAWEIGTSSWHDEIFDEEMKETQQLMAKTLISLSNFPLATIASVTGLTLEEVSMFSKV